MLSEDEEKILKVELPGKMEASGLFTEVELEFIKEIVKRLYNIQSLLLHGKNS